MENVLYVGEEEEEEDLSHPRLRLLKILPVQYFKH